MIVLGIDVGTTGTKTIAVDENGRLLGSGYREYELTSRAGGIVEQDAEDWWRAVVTSVGQTIAEMSETERDSVTALALSTQGASMTAVDRAYQPLCPALTWMDSRAEAQAQRLRDSIGGETVYRKCGWTAGASYDISKIMWLKEHRPELYRNTYSFVSTIEFINYRLTGRNAIDPTNAAIRGMYNINTRAWDADILKAAEVEEALLPEALPTGAFIGALTPDAAAMLGLHTGVRVYNGAHDQYCAALGCGALHSGDMLLSTGTTWVVLGVTDKPVYTDTFIAPGIHPCGGLYGAMASLTSAGSALKWLRGITAAESYAAIDREAEKRLMAAENEELFFLPYIAGAGFPSRMSGIGGSCIGMRLHHDAYDLSLALMEGVAFETKNALAEFSRAGIDIRRLKMIGGASKSDVWCALTQAVTGCEITRMRQSEACALGAALIAAVGAGMYEDYQSCAAHIVHEEPFKAIDQRLADYYEEKHRKYNQLSEAVKGVVKQW